MITVAILINGNPLMARSARRTSLKAAPAGKCIYQVDDGSHVIHDPDDGAVSLAIKLLKTIKEHEETMNNHLNCDGLALFAGPKKEKEHERR